MIVVLPFACPPGHARLARVLARQVQRRLSRAGAARFLPLAAEREGELFFLNRTAPFDGPAAARLGREQGARQVLDGAVAEAAGPLVFEARAWLVAVHGEHATDLGPRTFARGEVFDVAEGIAGDAARVAGLAWRATPGEPVPVRDIEALALFLEAEEMGMRPYTSAAEASAARARRRELLAEAARRDERIRAELEGASPPQQGTKGGG